MTPLKKLACTVATSAAIASLVVALTGCSSDAEHKAQTAVTETPAVIVPTTSAPPTASAASPSATATPDVPGSGDDSDEARLARFCRAVTEIDDLGYKRATATPEEIVAAYGRIAEQMQGSKAPDRLAEDWAVAVELFTSMNDTLRGEADKARIEEIAKQADSPEFQQRMERIGAMYYIYCLVPAGDPS